MMKLAAPFFMGFGVYPREDTPTQNDKFEHAYQLKYHVFIIQLSVVRKVSEEKQFSE